MIITNKNFRRMVDKKMEMVWLAGEGGKEGEIFTGVNYHTYSPPPGEHIIKPTKHY